MLKNSEQILGAGKTVDGIDPAGKNFRHGNPGYAKIQLWE
jgi:hypothetical protein